MLVTITRDCQIDGVFYPAWSETEIDDDLFQSDCMNGVSIPEQTEEFDPSLEDEDTADEVDETIKPPSKKKK